jgi:hypothetical protein
MALHTYFDAFFCLSLPKSLSDRMSLYVCDASPTTRMPGLEKAGKQGRQERRGDRPGEHMDLIIPELRSLAKDTNHCSQAARRS